MPDKPLAIIRAEESALEVPSPINSYQYGAGQNVETENQVLAYWRLIMARKWIVVGAFALVFTFVAVATYRLTPRYTATASLVTNLPSSAYLPQGGYGVQEIRVQEMTSNIQTQMDILSSRAMAERVVKKMNLVQRPDVMGPVPPSATEDQLEGRKKALIGFVSGGLRVTPRRASRVIDLAFESHNPTISAEVLNTFCSEFIAYDLETRTNTTSHAAEWLQSELGGMKSKMEESQTKLVDYVKEHPVMITLPGGSGDKGNNPTVEQDRVAQLSREYMEAEANRISIEAKYRLAKENNLVSSSDAPNSALQSLMTKRMDLKQQLIDKSAEYQDNSPQVQSLKESLADVEKEIENTKKSVSQDSLAKLEAEYNTAKLNEQTRKDLFEKERHVALEENGQSVQYELLKQDAEANEKLYNNLLQRLKEAQLSMGLQDPSARIVDTAQVPQFRSYPPVTRNLMMGGVLGLGFGIGLVFLLDYLDNTLKTTDDVNRILQLPALGIIPALGTLNKRRLLGTGGPATSAELISEHSADSGYAEAYRSLRTSVLLSLADHTPKTILVTSAQPSEGKTTTAINIAIALAQTGTKVLVIDADMRRPRCHKALGVMNKRGLSTFLASGADLDGLILETAAGIDILPCGPTPPNPSELLTSSRMSAGLRELDARYDHIVIDSPPVATVSDGLILAKSVDGVVLVVHGGQTSRNIAMRARQMLQNVGAKVFGVVLNKVDAGSSYYYDYYYKYGYYYSRDTSEGEEQSQS